MFLQKESEMSGERRNAMSFWNRGKKQKEGTTPPIVVRQGKGNSGNRFPVEVKVLAARAKESGLDRKEVADLIGASLYTVDKWHQMYQEGGPEALVNQSTSPSTRRICKELERRIEARRRENPEAGVRRIRDELRREEGVAVSAETVRRVLNDAGLNNTPPVPKRKPPQERRFERDVPNAMWQIDIFTFELKRMYRVYLVGIIDDHSRYIVGHGLFRQQTADAVLEVVRGAIGQWGAPRDILSDNGRQFVAWRGKTKFQKVLRRQGVQHVRSAPHHPMTLGKIERFWRTIWEEFLSDAVFASFADASQRLSHWVAYYNHQRPHQGIGGACPADRFYGIAGDVEEALKQGCAENALRLALGQETRQPLYLLGKLGETDVRVTRKGDDIEVKVGDVIHEMIRMGAPYELDENGLGKRGEEINEMEGHDGVGAVQGGGDGPDGGAPDHGDLPDVCSEPAGTEPGDGEGIGSSDAVAGVEKARQEGQECRGTGDHGAYEEDDWSEEDSEALEDEV
jgi:transposase InsO family protein